MQKTFNQKLDDIFSAIVVAPFGAMGIRTDGDVIQELVYLPKSFAEKDPVDAVAERAVHQITQYFQEENQENAFYFDLPLADIGTPFQRRVWAQIAAIPRGDILTYGEVARLVQSAPRAVGQACGANWFPLVIPCHRVTAAGGLGGFSHHDEADGFHLGVKRWLLAREGVTNL